MLGYLPQDFGVYLRVSAQVYAGAPGGAQRAWPGAASVATPMEALCCARSTLWEVRSRRWPASGGMRQRFGIAQALIGNPRLIIVDEPTAGLDPEERNRFNNLLSEIGEQVVVILSTHIVDDVTDLCPRAIILVEGTSSRARWPS